MDSNSPYLVNDKVPLTNNKKITITINPLTKGRVKGKIPWIFFKTIFIKNHSVPHFYHHCIVIIKVLCFICEEEQKGI